MFITLNIYILTNLKIILLSNWDVSIGDTEHWVGGRRRNVGLVYFCLICKNYTSGGLEFKSLRPKIG